MQNEFIEELRRKALEGEQAQRERIKKDCPWLSDEQVEEELFEDALKRTFNPKDSRGGEER